MGSDLNIDSSNLGHLIFENRSHQISDYFLKHGQNTKTLMGQHLEYKNTKMSTEKNQIIKVAQSEIHIDIGMTEISQRDYQVASY